MKVFIANIMRPIEIATVTVAEDLVTVYVPGSDAQSLSFCPDNFLAFAEAVARAKGEIELQQKVASGEPITREFSPDSAQKTLPGPWNDFHATERTPRPLTEQR